MRVISGKLKGKSINFLKSNTTRPLKDSVKENIFNIILHSKLLNINLKKSNILDLYSGTGSFGIECISRDANKVTFVEKDTIIMDNLKKNLSNLDINSQTISINDRVINFLELKQNEKFDIVFLDPPFANNEYIHELKIIRKKNILKKKHLIIIHRERKNTDNFEDIFKSLITKEYGRSKIVFGKF